MQRDARFVNLNDTTINTITPEPAGKSEVGQLREKMFFFYENLPELNIIAEKLEAVLDNLVGAEAATDDCTEPAPQPRDNVIDCLDVIHGQYSTVTFRLLRAMDRLKQAV